MLARCLYRVKPRRGGNFLEPGAFHRMGSSCRLFPMRRVIGPLFTCLLLAAETHSSTAPPHSSRPPSESRVSLSRLAERHALALTTDGKALTLRHALAEIVLAANSRQMRFNGTLVWLNDGIRSESGNWSASVADTLTVLTPLLDPQCAPPIRPPATVVVDPGHGGDDTGARAPHVAPEKELNLTISLMVAERLKSSGVKALLTRDADKALSLPSRPRLADSHRADVFVSVHINSASNRAVSGVETYLLTATGFNSTSGRSRDTDRAPGNRHDAANQILAYDVQRSIVARTGAPDRGVKRARFDVLSLAPCPAVLVECGFLSNPGEAASLASEEYRSKMADGITHGILTYLSRCEAQARRKDPLLPATNGAPDHGSVQTDRTDRADRDTLQDGTGR